MVEDWPAEKKNEHGGSTGNEADENSGKRRVQTFAIFQLGSEKARKTAFSLSPSSLTLAGPVHCGPCLYATEAFTFFQLKGGRLWQRAGCSQLRKAYLHHQVRAEEPYLHPFVSKRREMAQPVPTKAFLQPAKAAAMCTAPRAETLPPPPITPFC